MATDPSGPSDLPETVAGWDRIRADPHHATFTDGDGRLCVIRRSSLGVPTPSDPWRVVCVRKELGTFEAFEAAWRAARREIASYGPADSTAATASLDEF
jgi:hypothetical protein